VRASPRISRVFAVLAPLALVGVALSSPSYAESVYADSATPASAEVAPRAASATVNVYWDQAVGVGGSGSNDDFGWAVATTSDDTVLLTGYFDGSMTFPTGRAAPDDSITLTGDGREIFIAALSKDDSTFAWAQRAGGSGNDDGRAVVVTSDDTVLISGFFTGSATFPTADDSITLVADGGAEVFVAAMAKDDSTFAWAQRAGSSGSDLGLAMAVTSDDTVVITGQIAGSATFPTADDSITLTTSGSALFVAAMAKDDSTFTWAQATGSTGSGRGQSVAVTSDDTILVTGDITGEVTFPTADDSITVTSPGDREAIVAAMPKGTSTFAWAQRAGGTTRAEGASIAVTSDDRVIVGGYFTTSATFPTGGVAPDDSITLTGDSREIFVAELAPGASTFTWAQSAGGSGTDALGSVAIDSNDMVIVTGYISSSASFPTGRAAPDDSITLTSAGARDVFVAGLYRDDSTFAWAQRAGTGGSDSDAGQGVAVNSDDTILVTGYFKGSAMFPTGATADDSITLTAAGKSDVFLGWMGPVAAPAPSPSPPGPSPTPAPVPVYAPSAPQDVVAEPGDGRITVTWKAPASSGSFPITNYQAIATPGAGSCVVGAGAMGCDVTGLVDGASYTVSVRALSGAGWGTPSAAEGPIVPDPIEPVTMTITGTREGRTIMIEGTSVGVVAGTVVRPWVKLRGQSSYSQGVASRVIGSDGAFTWQRKTGKKTYVYFRSEDGSMRSARVVVAGR